MIIIIMQQILAIFKQNPQRKTKDVANAFYYIFALCLSEFYFGYMLVYLSAVDFKVITEVFNIDFDASIAQGIFQGIMPIGGAVGAVSSAYFIGLFSRRNLLFFVNAIGIILCLMSMVTNYKIFFVVRFLQGACCGLFSAVIPMIIREVSPHEISSITGLFANAFIIVGIFFLYLFGYLLGVVTGNPSGSETWIIIFLFPIVVILLQYLLLTKVYPFQTPKYLAHNNMKAELRVMMAEFYKKQYVEQMYEHYMKHHGPAIAPSEEDHRSDSAQKNLVDNKGSKSALFYGIFYAFLCPMSGINVVMSYGGEIVSAIAPSLRSVMPAVLMLFYLLASVVSVILLKKYGRKALTIYGTVGLFITLYVIAFAYFIASTYTALSQVLIVICLFVYLLVYGLTYAPVMWIWVSQALLPHTIGYAVMTNWSGAAFVMILFPILLEHLPNNNPGYIFLFFGIYLTFSLSITSKFMLQTKDKYEHEIMKQYKKLDEQIFGKVQSTLSDLELHMITNKQ